ncbi:MAG: hypothetical protein JW791_05455 [Nanoarchaeota archaeon]|nr:hypothetical protein [Nanoarchaeota archaeon]
MPKCEVCKKDVTELVMGKIRGTYLKGKGKLFIVCNACQKEHGVDEIKKKLKVK